MTPWTNGNLASSNALPENTVKIDFTPSSSPTSMYMLGFKRERERERERERKRARERERVEEGGLGMD